MSNINLKLEQNNKKNMFGALLIFYLLMASNLTENLISNQMREFVRGNRMIQHLIGLMTVIVILTLIDDSLEIRDVAIYGLAIYFGFIITTKCDIHWNIVLVLIIFLGYLYEKDKQQKKKQIIKDKNLTDIEKTKIINEYDTNTIYWVLIIVAIIGTIFYSDKKQMQYGGGYDPLVYLFN
jgi:uncharacterized membrane protein